MMAWEKPEEDAEINDFYLLRNGQRPRVRWTAWDYCAAVLVLAAFSFFAISAGYMAWMTWWAE